MRVNGGWKLLVGGWPVAVPPPGPQVEPAPPITVPWPPEVPEPAPNTQGFSRGSKLVRWRFVQHPPRLKLQ
ncbi:MAG: hypothetical protein FJ082_07305 [Cyanobacteria bacterium K_Offshore_surface_m2_011]|nr:hypothetical protein [Cyanobacteria bacterium K_Offshore_surface_m2_011]